MIQLRANALIGATLVLLGATTMLGWLLRVPAMVEIVHGLVPMVFNTGLGFALTGIALLAGGPRANLIRRVIGWSLIVLCGLTLLEHVFDARFGIDMAWVHHWYDYGNTRPGRMAPNTALGFVLIGAVNVRLGRVESRGTAYSVVILTFCLLTIGLTGLVGYLLAPDLLFGWSRSARMAVHTASGMIAAAIGLWMGWYRSPWFNGSRFFTEAAKVRLLGTAILIVVTTTVGLTGFVLMQKSLEKAIEGRLASVVDSRSHWMMTMTREIVQHARAEMRLVDAIAVASPLLDPLVKTTSRTHALSFDQLASRLLDEGYQHIAVENLQGQVVRELGDFAAAPRFQAVLDSEGTELVWNGTPMLRVRLPILRAGVTLGHLRLDRLAVTFGPSLFQMTELGGTAELSACVQREQHLVCMPNSRNAAVFRVDLAKRVHTRPLPMQLALTGKRGIVYALDYKDNNVVAAYAPVMAGIGIVAKQDTVEAYSVIRNALEFGVPVIVLISILGAFALYSQMDPLVSRMHASELHAEQAAAETRALMHAVGEGIMTIEGYGIIRAANPAACRIFGYENDQLFGQNVSLLIPPEMRDAHQQGLENATAGGQPRLIGVPNVKVEGLRRDGTRFPLELTLSALVVEGRRQFVGVMRDITERQTMEDKLARLAQYDSLTGLANRNLFIERLQIALMRRERSGNPIAVMFIDLDGFKQVNDTFGHHGGDELLVATAARMKAAVRSTDTVARLGGDEFTVLLEDMTLPAEHALMVANKLLVEIQHPFDLAEGVARIGASVGLIVLEKDMRYGDIDDILREADARMYVAKQAGKNRVVAA